MSNYRPLEIAKIDWQTTPKSIEYDDIFFSSTDYQTAITESEQVFFAPNKLPDRFLLAKTFSIGETGFGTGLNFLVAARDWLNSNRDGTLYFYSVEKHPWKIEDLHQVYQAHPLQSYATELINNYPELVPGWHRLVLFNGRIELRLFFGEAIEGFNDLELQQNPIDAWFLDGFAPSKNPDMWSVYLFKSLRKLSKIGTTLASFSVASSIRKNLFEAGFHTEKIPGFGRKREMLAGKVEQPRNFASKTPWYLPPTATTRSGCATDNDGTEIFDLAIVGAGLAGAAIAQVFAKQGYKVAIVDKNPAPAQATSGNPAGILHLPISADWNLRTQWYFHGLQTSWRYLKPWLDQGRISGKLDGLLQLIEPAEVEKLRQDFDGLQLNPKWASWCDQNQASELAGGKLTNQAIFYQQAGWVNPAEVVKACLDHPNISFLPDFEVSSVIKDEKSANWKIFSKSQAVEAKNIVFATASNADMLKMGALKIRPLRGQITEIPAKNQNWQLQKPLLHQGYSIPLANGDALVGASYDDQNLDLTLRTEDQIQNIRWAETATPDWLKNPESIALAGRAGIRAATQDHLPLIGGLIDEEFLQQKYLRQDPHKSPFQFPPAEYISRIFISNGHGSRGLSSVFLAAEILFAQITGAPSPLPVSLYNVVHPARFAIRNWLKPRNSSS